MPKHFALLRVPHPSAALAAPESYTIDPSHTFPNFTIDHQGIATMHGRFDKTSGKVMLDRAAKTGSVDLTIETASITTGDNDKGAVRARATSICARPISSSRPNSRA